MPWSEAPLFTKPTVMGASSPFIFRTTILLEPGCTLAIRPGYQHTVTAEPAAVGEAAAEG